MSVAVIIPNLNYGQYLERALNSIHAQTIPPDEIIVVDGGSDDNSLFIAASAGVRLIVSPPCGIGDARNVGIMATGCEYIVPLDADDWIAPTFIERCLEKLDDPIVGIIGTNLQWPDGRIQKPVPPFTTQDFMTGNRLFTCSMFRRFCWAQVDGYSTEPGIFEDWLLWAKIVTRGWKISIVDEPLFHHEPHPNSSSSNLSATDQKEYWLRTVDRIALSSFSMSK